MFWNRRIKLRSKIALIIMGASLVPLSVALMVTLERLQSSQRSAAADLNAKEIQLVTEEIEAFVLSQFGILENLIAIYPEFSENPAAQKNILIRILFRSEHFVQIAVTDESGQEIAKESIVRVVTENDLESRADLEGFSLVKNKQPYLGPTYIRSGRAFFDIGYPILTADGTFLGAVFAQIDARLLQELVTEISPTGGGRVFIVDNKGIAVAHPDFSHVLARRGHLQYPAVQAAVSGDGSARELDTYENENGVEVLGAGDRVVVEITDKSVGDFALRTNWFVIAENPASIALHEVAQMRTFGAFTLAGTLLFAGAMGVWFARRIVRPIERLHTAARAIGEGDLSYRAQVHTNDEIEDLAVNFNEMAEKLGTSIVALRRDRKIISSIIENLTDGIIEHDEHNRILLINPVAEQLLGVRASNIIGKKIDEGIFADPHKNVQKIFALPYVRSAPGVLDGQDSDYSTYGRELEIAESEISEPVHRYIIAISLAFEIEENGVTEQRFLKIIRDVTRERLVSEMKSEFITVAAHQMRTPLSGLKWAFRALLDEDMGSLTAEQKSLVTKGYETNEHMIHMVNDLLNVSRIEEGQFGYAFSDGNLMALLERVVKELGVVAQQKDVQIVLEPALEPVDMVFDHEKLAIAFTNILENAINYTPSGGVVRISVDADESDAVVSVEDTGIGIPKDQIPKLFTKFYRGRNVRKVQTEGSGLGLFLVKNIVTAHGGTVAIDSVEGEGTTVQVRLPIQDEGKATSAVAFESADDIVRGL